MGAADKARDKVESAKGAVKKNVGQTTGNKEWEAEGRGEQAKGDIKQAGEKIKDAVRPK